ncbi:MAG: hypothetical protein AABX49_01155 [Nanoarchaeota archaeon]
MDKKKTILAMVFVLLLILPVIPGMHAQNNIVSKFEKVTDAYAPTLKISFHSWGEGRTEKLNLDQYFPIKRDQNSRYVYLAPPEVSVSIDQTTGIATLTSFKDWTGTREIIFALTDIYSLETTISNLQKYRDIITQQRAPVRLKEEFEDLPAYQIFEKILDDLESEAGKASSPKIEVSKVDNNVKISVGKDTNLELDLETLTGENIPTLKPRIGINIQPEEEPTPEEETGLSIFIFIPLILIVITLAILGAFYINNNKERIKKHFRKEKQKPTAYNKLIEQKRELSSINSKFNQQPIKESENEAFNVIKNFLNAVTPEEYQFSYSEIKKEQFEKGLSNALKEKLCKFSREISDTRFSGKEIAKPELKNIMKQVQQLITSAADEERLILADKEHERLKKTFSIKVVKYVLDSFSSGKEISASRVKESIDVKKKTAGILHRLGIIKTLAEKEFERKREYLQKLKKIKEKEQEKELEKRKLIEEKRKKELLKIKIKQQRDHLKWLEAQRKIREADRTREEKIRRRLERVKTIRDFFHDRFGLFKTVKDIEKQLEKKREKQLEKEKTKRIERKRKRQSVLNFLHFLRIYKTSEEKHEEELILKREEKLERQHKERKKEARKQSVLNFLHSLKLYRTREEVEKEKERRLRKLREKQKAKEEEYKRKELESQQKRRQKQNEKLKELEEKKRKQHIKSLEKAKKTREKELAKEKIRQDIDTKKKELKKLLHDKLGLFKTLEEKEHDREEKYKEKLRKQKIEEEKRLQKLKKKHEEKLRKQREEEKKKNIKLEAERKKRWTKEKEKHIREKETEEKRKIREQKISELKKRINKQKTNLKNFLHKQLHDHFGSYKTEADIESQKEKIRKKLIADQKIKKERETAKNERKRKLRTFLHDKLGLFKTREEIEKSRLERKRRLVEIEHKLEDTVLKSLASRLERKKLTPEQEIKILMQMEEEALRKGDSGKLKDIQKKINRLYSLIKKHKPKHPSLILAKFKNSIESARDHIFSSASKMDSLSPFIKKLNYTIRSSLTPKVENAKIDQINYLVNKAEVEIRRNRKEDAKEYYKRAVYLYRSLNKASQKIALPALMKVKNEITSMVIVSSLEKAFSAVYTGQVKKAETLYKDIDMNFLNLPTHEREKIYDKKEELYQSIKQYQEHKPVLQAPKVKNPVLQTIKSLFKKENKKEEKQKFFPLTEEHFKSKQLQETVKKEENLPEYKKRESFTDFILARRPKFTSIKTEVLNKKFNQSLTKKLFAHIKAAESHLQRKSHERAHHNYKAAIEIFKDLHLNPGIRDNVYNQLSELKEKILHTSIHNFMKKTKESVKKDEIEEAKKFHGSLEGIYGHLQRKKEKETSNSEIDNKQNAVPDLLFLERKLDEAFSLIKKGDKNNAMHIYNQINDQYNNLKPERKKEIYSRLITLYSELIRK